MDELILRIPATIIFGADALTRVSSAVSEYGSRALILTESALREAKYVPRLQDLLERRGIHCIVYDDVTPGGGSESLNEIISLARSSQIQMIIGMGGMKVLTAARLASMAVPNRLGLEDILQSGGLRPGERCLPYIEVPSSCRNHFMLKDFVIITDNETKSPQVIRVPADIAKLIVIDPRISLTLSPRYTGAVMMDSLLASIEGYLSPRASFLSDATLLQAIEMLSSNVVEACRPTGNERARTRAAEAGLLAAIGLSMSSQGVGGAVAYALNSRFDIPKSWVSTVLLPHIVDNIASVRPEKLARLARALGESLDDEDLRVASRRGGESLGTVAVSVKELSPSQLASRISSAIRRLIGVLDLPNRLRDFDLPLDEMNDVAEIAAVMDMSATSPVPFSAEEIFDLIKQAF
jgi:alcohol dehydrogenase